MWNEPATKWKEVTSIGPEVLMFPCEGQHVGDHRGEFMASNARTGELLLIQIGDKDMDACEAFAALLQRWPRPFVSW
jgi:hypothetical protein